MINYSIDFLETSYTECKNDLAALWGTKYVVSI